VTPEGGTVTDQERARADAFLDRIELAVGEMPNRDGSSAVLIAEILQAVNGLRALLGVQGHH
jgi:hypothetical protein